MCRISPMVFTAAFAAMRPFRALKNVQSFAKIDDACPCANSRPAAMLGKLEMSARSIVPSILKTACAGSPTLLSVCGVSRLSPCGPCEEHMP